MLRWLTYEKKSLHTHLFICVILVFYWIPHNIILSKGEKKFLKLFLLCWTYSDVNLGRIRLINGKNKTFLDFSNTDFNTLIWSKPNGQNPKSFLFSSLFRDRIKQMKILYYALNLELYKICTEIVHGEF